MLAGWANAKSSLAQAEDSARLAETELISAQALLSDEEAELRAAQEERDRPRPEPKGRFAESKLGKWSAQLAEGNQPSRVESAQANVDKAERTVDKAQRNGERVDRQIGSSKAAVDQWLVGVGVVAAVSVLALTAFWGPASPGQRSPTRPASGQKLSEANLTLAESSGKRAPNIQTSDHRGPADDDFNEWVTAAIQQMLFLGDSESTLAGKHLLATDGILHGYERLDIDWKAIWQTAAARKAGGLPPFGVRPYWTPNGPGGRPAPFSVLAFWGAQARLRISTDPDTDQSTLMMLAGDQNPADSPDNNPGDPHPEVRVNAARRL